MAIFKLPIPKDFKNCDDWIDSEYLAFHYIKEVVLMKEAKLKCMQSTILLASVSYTVVKIKISTIEISGSKSGIGLMYTDSI